MVAYSDALAEKICDLLADGLSLREICRQEDMPNKSNVLRWLKNNETFRDQYARAREDQADAFADEIIEIADDASNDWMERNDDDNEGWQANHDHINRSRLRIDSRKWAASKLAPKKYGDKVENTVKADVNLNVSNARDEIASRIAGLAIRTGSTSDNQQPE
jgi:hypothetical protein